MQENLTPLNVSLVLSRACRKLCLTKKTCSPIFEKQFPPPFHIYQHPRIFFSCNPIVVVGVMLFWVALASIFAAIKDFWFHLNIYISLPLNPGAYC